MVPGSWFLVPGSWFLVPGSWFLVCGSWFVVCGLWLKSTFSNLCAISLVIFMATLQRFEEIEAWQKARELTKAIYVCSGGGEFARDFGLCDQIRRAAVSIMANIAEGFERGGNKELIYFFSIAKGSVGEVEAQLYVALDQQYISQEQFKNLNTLTMSTKRLIAGFMNYLKQSNLKGQKYTPSNQKPKTRNQEPKTMNQEPGTRNQKP